MEDNSEKGPTLTRRKLLQAALAFSLGTLLNKFNIPSTETQPKKKDVLIEPKIIHGVEVYGADEPIRTLSQLDSLERTKEKEPFLGIKTHPNTREKIWQLREEALNPHKRYFEMLVSKSTYEKFEQEKKEGGYDFIEWMQGHMEYLNLVVGRAEGVKPLELQAILKRIIVIDDEAILKQIDPNQLENGKFIWKLVSKKGDIWQNDVFGQIPYDIDTRWFWKYDPRFFHNPNGAVCKDDKGIPIMDTEGNPEFSLPSGKRVRVCLGMIHEFLHHWGIGDNMGWLNENWDNHPLPRGMDKKYLNVVGLPGDTMKRLSALSAGKISYFQKELGLRGPQPDWQKYLAMNLQDPDNFVPINGYKFEYVDQFGRVIPPTNIHCYARNIDGNIQEISIEKVFGESDSHWSHLLVGITQGTDSEWIPIPHYLLTLSSLQKFKLPTYWLHLTGIVKPEFNKIICDLIETASIEEYLRLNPSVYAYLKVDGSQSERPVYNVWKFASQ